MSENHFDRAVRILIENPPTPPRGKIKKSAATRAADRYKSTNYWMGNIAEHLIKDGNHIHASDGIDLFDPEAVRNNDDRSFVVGDND